MHLIMLYTTPRSTAAVENKQSLEADRVEVESREKPRPLKVAVTASSSPLAYHLLHLYVHSQYPSLHHGLFSP